MAVATEPVADNLVDTAVGPIYVSQALVTGFDIDDFVTSTVQSTAISIKLYNLAGTVNAQTAQDRRVVSVGGASIGGYS